MRAGVVATVVGDAQPIAWRQLRPNGVDGGGDTGRLVVRRHQNRNTPRLAARRDDLQQVNRGRNRSTSATLSASGI